MKQRRFSFVLAATAIVGMTNPRYLAAEPVGRPGAVNRALAIKDVALTTGQAFHGVVISENGQPVPDTKEPATAGS